MIRASSPSIPSLYQGLDQTPQRTLWLAVIPYLSHALCEPGRWISIPCEGAELGIMRRGKGLGWRFYLRRAGGQMVRTSEIAALARALMVQSWTITHEIKDAEVHAVVAESVLSVPTPVAETP